MRSCCFTGHRIIKMTPELAQRLRDSVINVIEKGVTVFYDGGACGFDMLAAETVIELKAEYSDIKLHLLLPCPPEEQVKNWDGSQIERYEKICQAADSVSVLSEHYTRGCMKLRNKRLVELADCCICYYGNARSGTGQTVRIAQSKGIEIVNLL